MDRSQISEREEALAKVFKLLRWVDDRLFKRSINAPSFGHFFALQAIETFKIAKASAVLMREGYDQQASRLHGTLIAETVVLYWMAYGAWSFTAVANRISEREDFLLYRAKRGMMSDASSNVDDRLPQWESSFGCLGQHSWWKYDVTRDDHQWVRSNGPDGRTIREMAADVDHTLSSRGQNPDLVVQAFSPLLGMFRNGYGSNPDRPPSIYEALPVSETEHYSHHLFSLMPTFPSAGGVEVDPTAAVTAEFCVTAAAMLVVQQMQAEDSRDLVQLIADD